MNTLMKNKQTKKKQYNFHTLTFTLFLRRRAFVPFNYALPSVLSPSLSPCPPPVHSVLVVASSYNYLQQNFQKFISRDFSKTMLSTRTVILAFYMLFVLNL